MFSNDQMSFTYAQKSKKEHPYKKSCKICVLNDHKDSFDVQITVASEVQLELFEQFLKFCKDAHVTLCKSVVYLKNTFISKPMTKLSSV